MIMPTLRNPSFFETVANQQLSNHIFSFKDSQELLDWITDDGNSELLFKWHNAVRVAFDNTILNYNRLVEEKNEGAPIREALKVGRVKLIAEAERKDVEHQAVIKHLQNRADALLDENRALRERATAPPSPRPLTSEYGSEQLGSLAPSGASSTTRTKQLRLPDPPIFTDGKDIPVEH